LEYVEIDWERGRKLLLLSLVARTKEFNAMPNLPGWGKAFKKVGYR